MKILIFKDVELDISGVTPVWTWECYDRECYNQTTQTGHALFWENAMRGADHHIAWHAARERTN